MAVNKNFVHSPSKHYQDVAYETSMGCHLEILKIEEDFDKPPNFVICI
jgi:hypothetical protein